MISTGDGSNADAAHSSGQQQNSTQTGEMHWCEAELEKHFKDHGNCHLVVIAFETFRFQEKGNTSKSKLTRGLKTPSPSYL